MSHVVVRYLTALFLCLSVAACGGGGGGGSGSLQLDPKSLSFQAGHNQPPPEQQTVVVKFQGDGVIVGYAPNVAPPSWLQIEEGDFIDENELEVHFRVTDTHRAGTFRTSVRFVTGREDGSNVKYVDMPITYTVGDFFGASTFDLSFHGMRKSEAMPMPDVGRTISIYGSKSRWTATSSTPWLTLSPASGNGPGTIVAKVNSSDLPVGTNTATVTVQDAESGQVRRLTANVYMERSPFTVSEGYLPFSGVRNGQAKPAPADGYPIMIGGAEARWTATSNRPWVSLSAASGTGPATIRARVNTSELPLGANYATINLYDADSGSSQQVQVVAEMQQNPFSVYAPGLYFEGIRNSSSLPAPAEGHQIQIGGADTRWTASSSQPWLQLSATSGTGPGTVTVRVNSSSLASGSNQATLTFRDQTSGDQISETVHVYLHENPFTAEVPDLSFQSIRNAPTPPAPAAGYTMVIGGDDTRWTASSSQPWLQLSASSGTGPGTVTLRANSSALPLGSNQATLTVRDATSGSQVTHIATVDIRAAGLELSRDSGAFVVDSATTASALELTAVIRDELGGSVPSEAINWRVDSISAPWLKVTPASGTTAPSKTLTFTAVKDTLEKLDQGEHTATVTFSYDNAQGSGQQLQIPVTLDMRLPLLQFVAPYTATADVPGNLYVRGNGFQRSGRAVTVSLASTDLEAVAPDGDTQLRVAYPALSAGRYPVTVKNALNLKRSTADLLVLQPAAYGVASIESPGQRDRIIYDAERRTLWAVDQAANSIERHQFRDREWKTLSPYILPAVTDIALTPDGRRLVATSRNAIHEFDLAAQPLIADEMIGNPDPFCGGYFDHLAPLNDGKFFVVFNLRDCSGFTASYLYDSLSHGLVQNPYFSGYLYNGLAGSSADGSRVYAGSNGVSPAQQVLVLDALNAAISSGSAAFNLYALSVSGDASRVLMQDTEVYSRSLSLLGHLPAGGSGFNTSLVSRDSSRAYVYVGGSAPELRVYNLKGALQPGAIYPLLKTIPLPSEVASPGPSDPYYYYGYYSPIRMAESPDGDTVFVSGDVRILVVPVK